MFSSLGFSFYFFPYLADFSLCLFQITFFPCFLDNKFFLEVTLFRISRKGNEKVIFNFEYYFLKKQGNRRQENVSLFSLVVSFWGLVFQNWSAHRESQRSVTTVQGRLGYSYSSNEQPTLGALRTHLSQEKTQLSQFVTIQGLLGHLKGKWLALCPFCTL